MICAGIDAQFSDELGKGQGVTRGWVTAFCEALLAVRELPALPSKSPKSPWHTSNVLREHDALVPSSLIGEVCYVDNLFTVEKLKCIGTPSCPPCLLKISACAL